MKSSRVLGVIGGSLVCLGLIAACDDDAPKGAPPSGDGGSSGASSGGSSGVPVAGTAQNATEFCDGTIGAVIAALEACCTDDDKKASLYAFTHDLAVAIKPACTKTLATSLQSGRVLTRTDRAQACYAAIQTIYGAGNATRCANVTRTVGDPSGVACKEAFVGTIAEGGGCLGDHECVDGLTCVGYTESSDGHCMTPRPLGEACGAAPVEAGTSSTALEFGNHPSCVTGAECDSFEHKCVAAPATSSSELPEGAACTASADACAAGLYCDGARCAALKSAGQPCNGGLFSRECAGRCEGESGQPGTCQTFCGSR